MAQSLASRISSFIRDERGAALVEFAVVLPFLLITLFAMISWGYSLTLVDTMYDAARKAAREMAVGAATEVQAVASAKASLTQWPQEFNVVAQDVKTTGNNDVRVTVTTTNLFEFMRPIVRALPPMTATVVMRKEL